MTRIVSEHSVNFSGMSAVRKYNPVRGEPVEPRKNALRQAQGERGIARYL
jgi:hypothetical protein